MGANSNTRTNTPTQVPALPAIPATASPEMRKYLETLSQVVSIRLGRRGDPRDRAVTMRELIDSGLAKELASSPFDPNRSGNAGFVQPGASLVDLAAPPAPTGFTASGAYSQINLNWDYPAYSNHSHTEVHVHTSDVIGDATLLGIQTGRIFVDPVGSGQTRYYWVRHVNTDGVAGPFNSASGTVAATATDVNHMLGVLTTAITSSQLATSLSTPIAKIDPLATFTGYSSSYSGNSLLTRMGAVETTAGGAATSAQLSTEATTRASADSALSSSITTLQSTVGSNSTSISTQATTVNGLSAQYSVKIDNNGHISGFGLSSTTTTAGPTSAFIVRADRFAVIDPASTADGLGTTTPTAANVPFFIDSGTTYIKSAAIKDASITSAKIGTLGADKITSGFIDADRIEANSVEASKLVLDNSTITSQTINGIPTVIIKDLGVGAAKIQNLAVSTLKIQDQAVTFPNAITTSANLSIASSSNNTTFSTIQTLTGTYTGAPVLISGSFAVRSHDDQALMRFRLRRGSTVLFTSSSKAVRQTPDLFIIPFNFLDTSTSTGSRTYTLQAYVQDQFGNYSDRTISTLEVKK